MIFSQVSLFVTSCLMQSIIYTLCRHFVTYKWVWATITIFSDHQQSLTLFTHLSIKFFFLLVCVVASKGVGKESCVCSSESNKPSQEGHLSEVRCIRLQSKLSLLSDSLSGRLYKDLTGEEVLLVGSCSQLCEFAEAFSTEECRLRRGL